MQTRNFTIFAALLISLLMMDFRCVKEPVVFQPYEQTFEIPVSIFPLKKAYSLADTLWIETDVPGKVLFDSQSQQFIPADTAMIDFGAGFNEFGTLVTNPPNGFCDVYTINGTNINRQLSQWGTGGYTENYGCGRSSYTTKVGFKPLVKGTYFLSLNKDLILQSCANKIVPYHATVSFRYKNVDLGLDIFNSLSKNDQGGNDGRNFYTDKINNREIFVFRVQ